MNTILAAIRSVSDPSKPVWHDIRTGFLVVDDVARQEIVMGQHRRRLQGAEGALCAIDLARALSDTHVGIGGLTHLLMQILHGDGVLIKDVEGGVAVI